MEIFNNLELTQQFLKENMKRVKNIDLDCHEISITFDGGGSVSIGFDVTDIVLNINYEAGEKKHKKKYVCYENIMKDTKVFSHRELCDGEWEDIYIDLDKFYPPGYTRKDIKK